MKTEHNEHHLPPAPPHYTNVLTAIVHLLASISRSIARRPRPFRESCSTNQRCGAPTLSTGVLRTVHNPTAGALQVTISDGENAAVVMFNQNLAAGAVQDCHIAFFDGLFCVAGAGAIVSGDFNA